MNNEARARSAKCLSEREARRCPFKRAAKEFMKFLAFIAGNSYLPLQRRNSSLHRQKEPPRGLPRRFFHARTPSRSRSRDQTCKPLRARNDVARDDAAETMTPAPDTNTEPDDADSLLADLEREMRAMGPNVRTLDTADDAALDDLAHHGACQHPPRSSHWCRGQGRREDGAR